MTGFIFDFNGTLFADADKQEIAWRQFAQNYAKKELSDQEFDDHVHGQNAELTLNYVKKKLKNLVSRRKLSTVNYAFQMLKIFTC